MIILRERVSGLLSRSAGFVERQRTARSRRGVILIYHRVAELEADPWGMAVSPANFADHLAVIRRYGTARTMSDFSRHLDEDGPADCSVAITFDDGYEDNLSHALPLLAATETPATVYVIADAIGDPAAFWWDRVTESLLQTGRLPETRCPLVSLSNADRDLGEEAVCSDEALARLGAWSADHEKPASRRQRLFLAVWAHIASLEPQEQRTAVAKLCDWASVAVQGDCSSRPLTPAELNRLAASPLIEIGGHTASHADLSTLSEDRARREIADGRQTLIDLTNTPVTSFAYPFGRFSPQTPKLLHDAGYLNATCSRAGVATRRSDRFLMPRLHVRNCSGEALDGMLAALLGRQATPLLAAN